MCFTPAGVSKVWRETEGYSQMAVLYEKRKRMITIGSVLLIGIICYLVALCCGAMVFLTNDDTSIQDTLSGRYTGSPFPVHQFISIFLSYPVYWLYRYIPGPEWWLLISQAMMLINMLLINSAVGILADKNNCPLYLPCVLVFLIDFACFCYPISNTAYTIVASFFGSASMLLLMTQPKRKSVYVLSALLFLVSVFYRYSAGIVMLCFVLLAWLLVFLEGQEGFSVRKTLPFILVVILFFGLTVGLNKISASAINQVNGADHSSMVSARGQYMDYPHDTFEENPQIYEDVGWSRDTYVLVNAWWYWDPNVTEESFRYVMSNSRNSQPPDIGTMISRWMTFPEKDNRVRVAVYIWLGISVLALVSAILARQWKRILLLALNMLGTVVLIAYQLYTGRILYRSLIICIIPSVCFSAALLVMSFGLVGKNKKFIGLTGGVFAVSLVLLGIFLLGWGGLSDQKADAAWLNGREIAQAEYVKAHPENIYIKHTVTTYDNSPYADRPVNLMDWGKPDYGSAAQKLKLKENGIDRLSGETMKMDNVYFLADEDLAGSEGEALPNDDRLAHLYYWLKEGYGATGIQLVDQVCDGLFVYHFVFDGDSVPGPVYDIQDDIIRLTDTQ